MAINSIIDWRKSRMLTLLHGAVSSIYKSIMDPVVDEIVARYHIQEAFEVLRRNIKQ